MARNLLVFSWIFLLSLSPIRLLPDYEQCSWCFIINKNILPFAGTYAHFRYFFYLFFFFCGKRFPHLFSFCVVFQFVCLRSVSCMPVSLFDCPFLVTVWFSLACISDRPCDRKFFFLFICFSLMYT